MGIYENGSIFGIRIHYNLNDDDFNNALFEKKYNKIMSDEEKRNAYTFYIGLNNKNKIRFEYYSECYSTYGEDDIFLMWCPMSLNLFLEKFGI